MPNGYLRFFVVNTSLDNDAENQLLLCAEIMCRRLALGNSHAVYQGETLAVDKVGIGIQKLLFCIQLTLFML